MSHLAWGISLEEVAPPEEKAGQEGFEPPSPGFGVRCSNRSSYWPVLPTTIIAAYPLDVTVFLGEEYAGDKNGNTF